MSDDWARQYIDIHKRKQQEKQDAQRRAELARVGAPGMFQKIKDRIRQDLKTFYDAGVLQTLEFEERSPQSFLVQDKAYPDSQPTLGVDLDMIFVNYTYLFPEVEIKKGRRETVGALRICSDLQGIIQVYNDRSPFADESDVSEHLLRPLLDFVDK